MLWLVGLIMFDWYTLPKTPWPGPLVLLMLEVVTTSLNPKTL